MNIVIIGAGGLIGRNLSEHLSRKHNLMLADINIEALNQLNEKLNSNTEFNHSVCFCDITSNEAVKALIEKAQSTFSSIDAVINCSYPKGKNYGKPYLEVNYQDFCQNTNLHLGGYFLVMQQFAEYFIQQKSGRIINFSSIYGVIPPKFSVYENTGMTMPVEYAAIKSGLIHLTKYTAQFMKGSGATANCISPGGVLDGQNTDFLQAYKDHCNTTGMLSTQAFNSSIDYLLSESGRYVTGQNLVVDDGFSL